MSSLERGILFIETREGETKGLREFPGLLFGATSAGLKRKDAGYGEVVFNTSITGYQEILTDPSYYGEIVCMTNPHIGNTGVNEEDPESKRAWCAGLVVHSASMEPSNWRSSGSLDAFLKKWEVPAITGIDTRALTRHLRSAGVTRGIILREADRSKALDWLKSPHHFEGRDMISEVTTQEPYVFKLPEVTTKGTYRIVAMDFGIKSNLLRSLTRLGCEVTVVPAQTTAEQILAYSPHGLFLSNGPGDPAAATYAHKTVKSLIGKLPIFGVCMGHQVLGLALGAKTYKLKFGHRGGNQPVFVHETERVEISSHNHGYAIDETTLPKHLKVTHTNLNDKCVEGMKVLTLPGGEKLAYPAFSVQYHPEACPGPHDSAELFNQFMDYVRKVP